LSTILYQLQVIVKQFSKFFILIFKSRFLFWDRLYWSALANVELTMYPSLASNSWSFCLSMLSAGITTTSSFLEWDSTSLYSLNAYFL
jgi:hypothetical protein